MMKSAIDWLMGKTDEPLALNEDLSAHPVDSIGLRLEQNFTNGDHDSSKENSAIFNGHLSGGAQGRNLSLPESVEKCRLISGEEIRCPWGRTLTPKSTKYATVVHRASPTSSRMNSHGNSAARISPSVSWDEMNFASDITSPGFASRIAKEARGGRKIYDGFRKYPIGQEKYIRSGVLPNVRLKGRSKPVVMPRRAPTSPLLPLASASSPFSSSSLASGFLASASTRMPDISSVVSVLDSTPSTSAFETISDPTSVQAVVAALEQAQSVKSGVKRSRFGETEDSNKKQKCIVNSTSTDINNMNTPIMNQAFNCVDGGLGGGGGGGGEKRALDLSPPNHGSNGSPDQPQLSPENKRRCIPDPRIASLSSSKNIANVPVDIQSSGRETPFSIYESHQDSDSESNKSLDSHQSRQSERSFKEQNHESLGRASNQDQFDRSGSQTPQSLRGSYGIGVSNGSNSSSRTTTPSRPSHVFSLEAYKTDKAKSHQRLNKMLGMLFNVAADEVQPVTPAPPTSVAPVSLDVITTSVVSSATPTPTLSSTLTSPGISGLLKEAFTNIQSEVVPTTEEKNPPKSEDSDVLTTYTFTLKPKQSSAVPVVKENDKDSTELPCSTQDSLPPPYMPSVSVVTSPLSVSCNTSSSETLASLCSISKAPTTVVSSSSNGEKFENALSKESSNPTSLVFPTFTFSSPNTTSAPNPLEPIKDSTTTATVSVCKSSLFNFGPSQESATAAAPSSLSFSFGKPNSSALESHSSSNSSSTQTPTSSFLTAPSSTSSGVVDPAPNANSKPSNLFSFGSLTGTPSSSAVTSTSTLESLPKPSIGSFTPSISVSGTKPSETPTSGLFNFGAHPSPNFIVKDKEPEVSKPSQPLQISSFNFGKSFPSSMAPEVSKQEKLSLFTFGSSQSLNPSLNSPTVNMNTPPPSSSEVVSKLPNPSAGGFTFSPSQASVPSSVPLISTSSSIFGNSSTISGSSNLFSFGSNPVKGPVSSDPHTSVSATSGIFSFGDAAKPTTEPSSPFVFGTATTSSSIPTPAFGGSIGGGFSFGGTKTTSPSGVLQFGAVTTTSSSSGNFNFNSTSTKPSGFQFSTPKTTASAVSSGSLFTFGGGNNQSPSFGTPTAGVVGGFGSGSTLPKAPAFSFASENKASAPSPFGAQSHLAPSFGSPDMGNKPALKSLFGGVETATPTFGSVSTTTTSPFGMAQSQNPFNPKSPTPTFGPFAVSKPGENTNATAPLAGPPTLNKIEPYQLGQQSANQSSSTFTFGQPNKNTTPPGVFMFGSPGMPPPGPGAPASNFGTGFNFSGAGVELGGAGTNLFTVGASSDTPTAPRRPKARAHRRR